MEWWDHKLLWLWSYEHNKKGIYGQVVPFCISKFKREAHENFCIFNISIIENRVYSDVEEKIRGFKNSVQTRLDFERNRLLKTESFQN
jgi:hypothetical protein